MSFEDFQLKQATAAELSRPRLASTRPNHNYPSSASCRCLDGSLVGSCLRNAWYSRMGIERTNLEGQAMRMRQELGHLVEDVLVTTWKEAGLFESAKTRFYDPELNLSGELDCVLRAGGELGLVEAKSIYGYYAGKEVGGSRTTRPYPKIQNLLQTMVYLWFFRAQINSGKIYYVFRDSGQEQVFNVRLIPFEGRHYAGVGVEGNPIERNGDLTIEGILDRYRALNSFVSANIPPAREYKMRYNDEEIESLYRAGEVSKTDYTAWTKSTKTDADRPGEFQCSYCDFRTVCHSTLTSRSGFSWATYQKEQIFDSPDLLLAAQVTR